MLEMGTWIFAPSSAWGRLSWPWSLVPLPHIRVCLTKQQTQPAPGLFQKQLPHVEAIEHVISQPDTESLPPPEGEELCRSQPGFSRKRLYPLSKDMVSKQDSAQEVGLPRHHARSRLHPSEKESP